MKMKQCSGVFDAAAHTLAEYGMLDGQRGVLVGYSGGADSSALLRILKKLCDERGIFIHALHVNHGIRGGEAERDAEFCRLECERIGVGLTLEAADIPRLARESGRGIEEEARAFRYAAFLRKIRSDNRITCIATAHNADDNAETVIFNMTRGSGLAGVCGIPPIRMLEDVKIIRPLISVTKSDILGYCAENGIEYIFDSTNADTAYTRNYIRHEVIPALRRLNPSFHVSVTRMTENLRADNEYLECAADAFLAKNASDGSIDAAVLSDADTAISARAAAKLFARVGGGTLERVHIDAVLALAKTARAGSSLSLAGGVRAKLENGRLFFTSDSDAEIPEFCRRLDCGVNRFENPNFAILMVKDGDFGDDLQKNNETLQNIYKLSILTQVNSDKIKNVLFVRSRRSGDSYVFGGMTRKLKKLYNDRGFTQKKRSELPIVCDEDGIVWVPGFPAADRVRSEGGGMRLVYYYNGEEK